MSTEKKYLVTRERLLWIRDLSIVVLAAFFIRLVYLVQYEWSDPFAAVVTLDSVGFDQEALEIVKGGPSEPRAFFTPPLYPRFLALVYTVFGYHYFPVRLLQAFLGIGTAVCVWAMGRKVFGPGVGLMAGIFAALDPTVLFYETKILMEPLAVPMVIYSITILVLWGDSRRWWPWAVAGFLGGLAVLTRPNYLLFFLGIAPWRLFYRNGSSEEGNPIRPVLARAGVLLGVIVLTMMPVTIHNFRTAGGFVPISWNGGWNFWQAWNPNARSGYYIPPEMVDNPYDLHERVREYAEKRSGREGMSPAEVSAWWFGEGMKFLSQNPGALPLLTYLRTAHFMRIAPVYGNYAPEFERRFVPILRAPLRWLGLLLGLGWIGLVFFLKNWRRCWPFLAVWGTTCLSVMLFSYSVRYALPVLFVLYLAAAVFLEKSREALRGGNFRLLHPGNIPLLVALALFLVYRTATGGGRIAYENPLLLLVGIVIAGAGFFQVIRSARWGNPTDLAILLLFAILVVNRTTLTAGESRERIAYSYIGAASAYNAKGLSPDRALAFLEEARSLIGDRDPSLWLTISHVHFNGGRYEAALEASEKAMRAAPPETKKHYQDEARAVLEAVEEKLGGKAPVLAIVAEMKFRERRYDDAVRLMHQAVLEAPPAELKEYQWRLSDLEQRIQSVRPGTQ